LLFRHLKSGAVQWKYSEKSKMQISASMVKELRERTGSGMMECKNALVEVDGDIDLAAENLRKAGQAKADKKAGRVAAEGVIAVQTSGSAVSIVELNCETDFVAKKAEFQQFADMAARCAVAEQPADAQALGALTVNDGGTLEDQRRQLIAAIGENITLSRYVSMQRAGDHFGVYLHQGAHIGVVVDLAGGSEELARDIAMHVAAINPLALDESAIDPAVLAKEKEIISAQIADSGKPVEIQEKMLNGRVAKYLKENTLLGQPFVKDPELTVAKLTDKAGARVLGYTRFEVGEGIEKKTENFAEEVMAQIRDSKQDGA
jgi:elongation factor Ts